MKLLFPRRSVVLATVSACVLASTALLVPVVAKAEPTPSTSSTAPSRAASRDTVLNATATKGYGLTTDDARARSIPDGCSSVPVPQAAFAIVALTATARNRSTQVSLGTRVYPLRPGASLSIVRWMPATSGAVKVCQTAPKLATLQVRVLGHTIAHNDSSPGGLVNVSSRIPLSTTSSGSWDYPEHAVPESANAVLVQISGSTPGLVDISSGGSTVGVAVGPDQPAQTLLLPRGALAWSSPVAGLTPDAVLLGSVTAPTDSVAGGALITPLASPSTVTGADVSVAGQFGTPKAGKQIPPTAVLVSLTGPLAQVADPLAAGRLTDLDPAPSTAPQANSTLLRLRNDGTFHTSAALTVTIWAYLSGDVIRTPGTVDLTLPASPVPLDNPDPTTLTFAGQHVFSPGQVLVVGPVSQHPGGVIAVVDSARYTKTPDRTSVIFHAGGLLDAFLAVSLVAQLPAPDDVITPSRSEAPNRVSGTAGLSFDVGGSFTLGSNPSVTAGISFNLSASVTLSVDVNAFSFNPSVTLHYAVDSSATARASVVAQGAWSGSKSFALPFQARGAVALGPVIVVPQLSSSLDLRASVAASVSLSSAVRSSAHVGQTTSLSFRGMTTTKDSNNGFRAPSFVGPDLTASASATADASVSFTLTLAVGGVAGPFAQASVGVRAELTPGGSPAWRVYAYADFQVGIDLNALDIRLLSSILRAIGVNTRPSWQIGHLGPYEIRRGNSTSGGGQPGVGGDTGGSGSEGGGGAGPGGGGSGSGGSSNGATTPAPAGASVTVGQGPAAPYGYRYAIALRGFTPNTLAAITCKDSSDPSGYYYFSLPIDGSGNASTAAFCYSADGPEYWVDAGGLESNHARWSTGGGSTPPDGSAHVDIAWSSSYPGWVTVALTGFGAGSYGYTCHFGSGGDASFTLGSTGTAQLIDNGHTCYDRIVGDTVQVIVGGVASNVIVVGGTPQAKGVPETVGGNTNTWTDYGSAGGSQGATIPAFRTVMITCAVQGFRVADGNTWWYRVNTAPWSDSFYASADAFYNNGQTSGSLRGTPFVDPAVPLCNSSPPPPPSTWTETTGGNANTWTNYTNAGGYQGPTIPGNTSVQIACALTGFRVPDGNTWWYRIASSPWNNAYYVSADPFYNNGQVSGPLAGTPFVDPAVPLCSSLSGGFPETVGGSTNTWTNYTNAGGNQGPTIGAFTTVSIACRLQGFRVPDGNTWWYRIAADPWSNMYYASADAFYNNGQVSGSLTGTPFVDERVPLC